MKFNEALGEVIREERIAQGRTLREVSGKGSLSLGHLCDTERGNKEPSSQIIEAIAVGLGKSPYELILETGLKMYRESAPELLFAPKSFDWSDQYSDLVK
jgi:transcriptional regulator with XRE-family HTH domain